MQHAVFPRGRRVAQDLELPEVDGPVPMFDHDDQALDEAKARHPARPVTNVHTGDAL
jgi:hypothetical protein